MTMSDGDPTVVKLVKGATSIYIDCEKVDEIIANAVTKTPIPLVMGSQDTINPGILAIDLKQMTHVFNIQGMITLASNPGEGYTSVKEVKDALVTKIIYPKGDIELHYRSYADSNYGSYYASGLLGSNASTTFIRTSLDKVLIGDTILRADTGMNSPEHYKIQINLTRGKIRD